MGTTDRSIAQNTILLYIRLIVVIFVAFFTQRLVLKALGVEDYGIYNVVGGLIVVIGIINTGMIQASQRFFAFEIGRGKQSELKNIFGAALTIHALISIFVLLFAEILGVWFLNSIMTIPPDRLLAANFVFQATICSLLITVWTVPFDALIIAKEDFNIYAYISIVEYFLKLGIAYFISTFELYDKLIIYSWLLVLVTILCKLWSIIYGKRKYKECLLKFNKDRNYIKKMLSFASFSFIGNIGFVLRNQGVNLVLNIFFGPAINAARGVAYQVSTQVSSFAGNFQMAATPQITKNYANGNISRMQSLIYKSSKYSFCLLFILALPVAVNPHPLLELWLIHPPIYSDIFLQLSIVVSLIENRCLYETLQISEADLILDLSDNLKKFENKRYILTTKKMNYQIVKKFALELRPIELNVIMNNEGEGIYLYDSSNPIKNNEHISKIDLLSYKYKIHSLLAILNKIGIYSLFCLFIRRIIKRK